MRPFLLWRGTTGLSLGTRFPREMRGGEGTAEATAHLSGDHPNGRERLYACLICTCLEQIRNIIAQPAVEDQAWLRVHGVLDVTVAFARGEAGLTHYPQ